MPGAGTQCPLWAASRGYKSFRAFFGGIKSSISVKIQADCTNKSSFLSGLQSPAVERKGETEAPQRSLEGSSLGVEG